MEAAEIAARRRRAEHRDFEEPGIFEFLLQDRGGQFPVVVRATALSIEEKHVNWGGGRGPGRCKQCGAAKNGGKLRHIRFPKSIVESGAGTRWCGRNQGRVSRAIF